MTLFVATRNEHPLPQQQKTGDNPAFTGSVWLAGKPPLRLLAVRPGLLPLCRRRVPGDRAAIVEDGGIRSNGSGEGSGEAQGGESGKEGVFLSELSIFGRAECPASMHGLIDLCGQNDNVGSWHWIYASSGEIRPRSYPARAIRRWVAWLG